MSLLFRYSSGPCKSFHEYRKVITATVASTGVESGSTTCVKICHSFAPSTRAASESSGGMVLKNWRSRKISKALAKNEGTISGTFSSFVFRFCALRAQKRNTDKIRKYHAAGGEKAPTRAPA